jgi:hypothetical protein
MLTFGTAGALRKDAVAKEQQAAKLRIQAWKLEGKVSAVTQEITLKDRYERQLAELDLMAEDWIDADEEKWDWYQKQRTMIQEMIGAQKEYDAQADAQLQDLKDILLEIQDLVQINTVDDKNEITTAGWVFVSLSVIVPIYFGYEVCVTPEARSFARPGHCAGRFTNCLCESPVSWLT